jgi:hypothetical protein
LDRTLSFEEMKVLEMNAAYLRRALEVQSLEILSADGQTDPAIAAAEPLSPTFRFD